MSALRQPRTFTFDEYLRIEREAPYKSDFLDGVIYSMAGGSTNHSFIAVNVATALSVQLRGSGCRVANSDLMIALEDLTFSAYPDASVICGPPKHLDERRDVLLNPCLIVEVISPSTETYDRGEIFERYKRMDSLIDYLLISQDQPLAEIWHREAQVWTSSAASGLESSLPIPSLGIILNLSEVYEGVL
ncbi:MAG: Uma2 family endonuclease [Armatimonadetes bacterium]|nr:Uma2 family endonuclease [Armatimonadota bacterium]